MFKTFWCNWIKGRATEEQVTAFYDRFSNHFELIKEFQEWGLCESIIDSPAELILKHRGSSVAYEALICEFTRYKRCADGYAQYLIRDKRGEERTHTLIYDRGKVYRVIAHILEVYDCIEDYVKELEKEDLFLMRRLGSWCKS